MRASRAIAGEPSSGAPIKPHTDGSAHRMGSSKLTALYRPEIARPSAFHIGFLTLELEIEKSPFMVLERIEDRHPKP